MRRITAGVFLLVVLVLGMLLWQREAFVDVPNNTPTVTTRGMAVNAGQRHIRI